MTPDGTPCTAARHCDDCKAQIERDVADIERFERDAEAKFACVSVSWERFARESVELLLTEAQHDS